MITDSQNIYLTFDIDWAANFVIRDLVEIIEKENIHVTFFCTHYNAYIESIKSHPLIEFGIHPNYNPLLTQESELTAIEILKQLKGHFPDAVSLRAHSLFQNSNLLNFYQELGIKLDSNTFVPEWSGIKLSAYPEVNGILRVPYFWEDDIYAYAIQQNIEQSWSVEKYISSDSLKVFDFHPIHVYLNTEHLDRYGKSRAILHDEIKLSGNKFAGTGTRTFLLGLIKKAKSLDYGFKSLKELLL